MRRDLAVIVPSRDRPAGVAELCRAWDATAIGRAKLYVVVDADTAQLSGYQDLAEAWDEADRELVVQHGVRGMVPALNKAAARFARQHFAVGFMGDDHRPRTPGWDEDVVAALGKLGTGVVTGQDGFRRDQLPTWVAMTSDIVRALGYMAPPQCQHMYVDNAWKTLGLALDAFTFLPDVLVEHMHPVAGKAEMDAGYVRVNDARVYREDEQAYSRWVREDLAAGVARIRGTVPA